uniref:Uncharacterized protein n=1 Tax=Ditylum brightwellii TaxID=49249 RepID=A0A6U3TQC8_9STRA
MSAKIQNIFTVLLLSILVIALCGTGTYFVVKGRSNAGNYSQVNVWDHFAKVNASCTVTSMIHTYETKRKREEGDTDSDALVYDECDDTVQYQFTVNGDESGVEYTSRKVISFRNRQYLDFDIGIGGTDQDLCTPDDDKEIEPYSGSYLGDVNFTPFACDGICDTNEVVDCWTALEDEFNQKWANCGNDQCYKLVDPNVELEFAQVNTGNDLMDGRYLIALGVAVAVFSAFAYFCFRRGRELDDDH